jgi:hypothetical protein
VDEAKVGDVIAAANRVVEAANLPDDLRATAFAKAVDLLAGSVAAPPKPAAATPDAPGGDSGGRSEKPAGKGTAGSLDAAARTLKIERSVLDAVVAIENGQPVLQVSPASLESKARPAMRQIILVLTAVRQAGGWDDQTDSDVIKKQMDAHYRGQYDAKNFTNAITDQKDSLRNAGGGKLKMLPSGFPAAAKMIREMAGVAENPE